MIGGSERILFVDDEEILVELAEQILGSLGYHLILVTNPIEALGIFRTDPASVDLVITDQTMPKMTGLELSRQLKQIRPDIPIIISTGYSTQVNEIIASEMGLRAFLKKPVNAAMYATSIRAVLDESADSHSRAGVSPEFTESPPA